MSEFQNEIWRPVAGYEGLYEISNLGRLRSLPRQLPRGANMAGTRIFRGKIITPDVDSRGYHTACLHKNNTRFRTRLHRLVAAAFIGSPPTPDHQVNHLDGRKGNNIPSNLEWCTASENLKHKHKVLGYRQSAETLKKIGDGLRRAYAEGRR